MHNCDHYLSCWVDTTLRSIRSDGGRGGGRRSWQGDRQKSYWSNTISTLCERVESAGQCQLLLSVYPLTAPPHTHTDAHRSTRAQWPSPMSIKLFHSRVHSQPLALVKSSTNASVTAEQCAVLKSNMVWCTHGFPGCLIIVLCSCLLLIPFVCGITVQCSFTMLTLGLHLLTN